MPGLQSATAARDREDGVGPRQCVGPGDVIRPGLGRLAERVLSTFRRCAPLAMVPCTHEEGVAADTGCGLLLVLLVIADIPPTDPLAPSALFVSPAPVFSAFSNSQRSRVSRRGCRRVVALSAWRAEMDRTALVTSAAEQGMWVNHASPWRRYHPWSRGHLREF